MRKSHTRGKSFDPGLLDRRPIIVALAGPNGAGKTTFFEAHLAQSGLPFLNADRLARDLEIDPYNAAHAISNLRSAWAKERKSFIFETVFSDPVGDKLTFLKSVAGSGYHVALWYIGLASAELSEERVAMRVSQGGHDVPSEKLAARFPRTLANLHAAIRELPHVLVFDNSDLARPFRQVAIYQRGGLVLSSPPLPSWLGIGH